MARTLSSKLSSFIDAKLVNAAGTASTTNGKYASGANAAWNWASGTAVDQADQVYESIGRTLTAGANETLDLAGSLVNDLGETVTFTKIKAIRIINRSTDASCVLTVGAAASNAWEAWCGAGSTVKVRPMTGVGPGMFELVAPDATGYAVGAGSTDNLKIANGGSAGATYDIIILGVKA